VKGCSFCFFAAIVGIALPNTCARMFEIPCWSADVDVQNQPKGQWFLNGLYKEDQQWQKNELAIILYL
jgi:hypothetical protein